MEWCSPGWAVFPYPAPPSPVGCLALALFPLLQCCWATWCISCHAICLNVFTVTCMAYTMPN